MESSFPSTMTLSLTQHCSEPILEGNQEELKDPSDGRFWERESPLTCPWFALSHI